MEISGLNISPVLARQMIGRPSGKSNGLIRTGVDIYLAQLGAMRKAGILGENKRLIAPLSGLDFIPGYFVGQMHTYDMRLPAHKVEKGFEIMHRAVTEHFTERGAIPAWSDFSCKVEHKQMNVLDEAFLLQIQEVARPGDVFFSKFMIDFLRVRETSGLAFQFVCKLIDVLPPGMFFVDYEKPPTIQKGLFPSVDLGLADYLAGTGKFLDITADVFSGAAAKELTGGHAEQAAIDGKSLTVRLMSEGRRLSFQLPLGGRLFVLKKTS